MQPWKRAAVEYTGWIHLPFDNEADLKLGQLLGELLVTSWLHGVRLLGSDPRIW
jgi:hypothetical protein